MSDKVYVTPDNLSRVFGKMDIDLARKSSYVSYTVLANEWINSQYSFESTYPSASYNILDALPSESATTEQRGAWMNADVGGYYANNIMIAHGTVPTINIPIMLLVQSK